MAVDEETADQPQNMRWFSSALTWTKTRSSCSWSRSDSPTLGGSPDNNAKDDESSQPTSAQRMPLAAPPAGYSWCMQRSSIRYGNDLTRGRSSALGLELAQNNVASYYHNAVRDEVLYLVS
jgi:hypothetical protein